MSAASSNIPMTGLFLLLWLAAKSRQEAQASAGFLLFE